MARGNRAVGGKLAIPARTTFQLDQDVRALANASVERGVKWVSVSHMANACLRHALLKFKPETLMVRVDPWEQLVFSKPISAKRRARAKAK